MSDLRSIIITIRSSDERTERACIQSVLDEGVSSDQIHVIKEAPFKKALEACFQVACESSAKWLLTLDADMILLPGTLEKFYREAEKMPEHFIQIQGKVLDKFYGEVRRGGPRFYRTKHLKKALEISRTLKDHIRPETNIIQMMGEKGHPARYISPLIALHDFGQYYADIYRKACVYAVKHKSKLPIILEQAAAQKNSDADYGVVLKGIYDSLSKGMDVKIDRRIFKRETKEALLDLDLVEKTGIPDSIQSSKIIAAYSIRKKERSFIKCTVKDSPITRGGIILKNFKNKGIMKTLVSFAGITLKKCGNKMMD